MRNSSATRLAASSPCRAWFGRMAWCIGLLAAVGARPIAGAAPSETLLLRFPAIHGSQIVFGHAGDLYAVSAAGGVARRLTSDAGYEMFPRFSPDGRWLAFTAQYDGNTEVYVMPAGGGEPRRLTYTATLDRDDVSDRMGPNNIVLGWKDARTIVYRSREHEWNDFKGQLCLVSVEGGLPEVLPLPRGGWCTYSPDGRQLAYNRGFREFRTWKRYRGGQADDLWLYDFSTRKTTHLTDHPAQDIFPMWKGGRLYFVSDRDDRKRMNLYVMDMTNRAPRQLTHFKDYDIKFPSLGPDAIVFENGGALYRFDLKTEQAHRLRIQVREDFAIGRGGLWDVSDEIREADVAPDGSRAVFGARGEVFTVPAAHGPTRNLTETSGVHERNARWSPDGRWIAYVSDATGEDEIWVAPQDGRQGAARQVTRDGDTYKYAPVWSPDSRKLLWADKKLRLQWVDVDTLEVVLVDQATAWEIADYTWSPDSQWVAWTRPEERQFPRVYLYSVAHRERRAVTDGWFASTEPAFSSDGKYLFFVSNRSFAPRYSQTEWNHAYFDMARIFLVTLAADTPSPLAPKSDEVKTGAGPDPAGRAAGSEPKVSSAPGEAKPESGAAASRSPAAVRVDYDGLPDRIAVLPIAASSYRDLASAGDKLFYTRQGLRDERRRLLMFDLGKEKETDLGEIQEYRLAAHRQKMLVRMDNAYAIVDLPAARIEVKERLKLGGLQVQLDRPAEWRQIFVECWRQMRDFVFDPHLHAVDWTAMRARYEPLLEHVHHRMDLTYLIGEMIGEINLGHCYVGGGDYPKAERIALGLLGADWERDAVSGYWRIARILPGQNWDSSLRSPLTEIGVGVKAGDYVIEIDGRRTDRLANPNTALVNTAGRPVVLRVHSEPRLEGSRTCTVIPIADDRPLRYFGWVQRNLERVSKATDGRIGYVHIPNMGVDGLNEFVKLYYPQTHKQGLIVDVRGNGGGNVSPQIIERLRREWVMVTVARNAAVNIDPTGMVLGPKVMLLDEFSASDGDIVAYRFRHYGLGPIIGKRSWGGVVGIRGSLPLLDGGYLNRPEYSRYDIAGREWIMEGRGVEPDIRVDNDPAREFAGQDDQLERAIAVILEKLEQEPVRIPPPPPWPDKSR